MMKVELIRDVDDPKTYPIGAMVVGDWAVIASSLSDDDYSEWMGCPVHRISRTKSGIDGFRVHFTEDVIFSDGKDFLVRDLAPNERIVITNRE